MTTSSELSFGGAIATEVLIGRSRELDKIRRAIGRAAREEFRCVLIEADGGLGKTRLLREITARLGARFEPDDPAPPQGPWRYPAVLALPLIDVADPYLHTVVPFLRAVRDGLHPPEGSQRAAVDRIFRAFDAATEAYDQARDGEMPFTEVAARREAVIAEFEAAYALLTRRRRVVWFIDTLEQLFRTRAEIGRLFKAAEITPPSEQSTSSWLQAFIGKLPARTTLVLAGRPRPQHWAADIEHLVRAAIADRGGDPATSNALTRIDLSTFSEGQVGEYLAALHGQLVARPAFAHLAAYLHDNLIADPEQPAILYELTGGNPVRLAIYIDLLLNSDADLQAAHQSLAAIRAMPDRRKLQLRDDVDQSLLSYLTENLRSPEHQVIELLALMRRGLDLDRLCAIWRSDRALAARTMRNLLRLSFVKYRWKSPRHSSRAAAPDPEEIRIFLHDEFYAIYQSSFLRETPEQLAARRIKQHQLYRSLIDFCEAQFTNRVRLIDEEEARRNTLLATLRDRPGRAPDADSPAEILKRATPEEQAAYAGLRESLRRLRHERRQLRTESLHYELFDDPTEGFYGVFFRRSEQAFSANAVEHDAQIQSELELFFFGTTAPQNGQQTFSGQEDWEHQWRRLRFAVILQQVSSWIKRLTLYGRYAEAQRLAARAAERDKGTGVPTLYDQLTPEDQAWAREARTDQVGQQIEQLFRLEWQANGHIAAIFEGLRVHEAITGLSEVQRRLQAVLNISALVVEHPPAMPGMDDVLPLQAAQRERFLNVVAQCYRYIGFGYATQSQYGTARANYLAGLGVIEETGFQTLRADLTNDLSRVLGELGDLDEAQYQCQLGMAIRRARGFDYLRALSFNTMALICSRNWLPLKARVWAEEALSLFRQLDQPRGIGLALLQVAESYRRTVSLMIHESQLLRAGHGRGRLPLSPAAIQRADSDLRTAEAFLNEAEAIFVKPKPAEEARPPAAGEAKQVPELLRRIEVFAERAALYREWTVLRGEDATGEKYRRAMADFDEVIRLSQPEGDEARDYTYFQLAAQINKAQLLHKAGKNDEAEASIGRADALIDERYRLRPGYALDVGEGAVKEVLFRELGRIATLLASIELDREGDEAEIRQYMLAITYFQLYSPYEMPYLALTRRRLATLLHHLDELRPQRVDAAGIARKLKEEFQLYAVEPYLMRRNEAFGIAPRPDLAIDMFLK